MENRGATRLETAELSQAVGLSRRNPDSRHLNRGKSDEVGGVK